MPSSNAPSLQSQRPLDSISSVASDFISNASQFRKPIFFQSGLARECFDIQDAILLDHVYAKAAKFVTNKNDISIPYQTLSANMTLYRYEILPKKNLPTNSHNSSSSKSTARSDSPSLNSNGTNHTVESISVASSSATQFMLTKIITLDQIQQNDTIQVVVSPCAFDVNFFSQNKITNIRCELQVHTYKTFTYCDYCQEFLWGLVKQGVKCKLCKRNYHKKCAYLLQNNCPNDGGVSKKAKESQQENDLKSDQSIDIGLSQQLVYGESKNLPSSQQLLISDKVSKSRKTKVPHSFVLHLFKNNTCCHFCGKSVKGKTEYICKDCKIACHQKCANKIPQNCLEDPLRAMSTDQDVSSQDHFQYNENCSDEEESMVTDNDEKRLSKQMEGMEVDPMHRLSNASNNNVPLQRLVNSVRRPRGPPSLKKDREMTLLIQGWLVHYTNTNEMRMRHFWRLTSRAVILYADYNSCNSGSTYNKTFKTIQLSQILKVETNQVIPGSKTPCLKIVMSNVVYTILEDTSVAQKNNSIDLWAKAFKQALSPNLSQNMHTNREPAPHNPKLGFNKLGKQNSFHWSRDRQDQEAETIQDIYQIHMDEQLGAGQFGTVYAAKHRKKCFDVAIKCVDKKRFSHKEDQQLRHEVTVLSGLDDIGIVKIYNMFETPETVFVVMERLNGDMLELILSSEKGKLDERFGKYLIHQILIALRYLHKRCIVHCDLKPENVLILSFGDNFPLIKLCDFGFARIIGEKSFRTSVVGTPAYLAPEVLRNEGYNRSLDMWSVGVIIYVTLSGTFPFNEDEDINDQIENAEFMFPRSLWQEISIHAIDLIKALLQVKRRKRLSVDKTLSQVWLQDYNLWCDLRKVEKKMGTRWLTHESDDERWESYARRKSSQDHSKRK